MKDFKSRSMIGSVTPSGGRKTTLFFLEYPEIILAVSETIDFEETVGSNSTLTTVRFGILPSRIPSTVVEELRTPSAISSENGDPSETISEVPASSVHLAWSY